MELYESVTDQVMHFTKKSVLEELTLDICSKWHQFLFPLDQFVGFFLASMI
jgi:hypothetical protein